MSARTWSWIAPTLLAALPGLQAGCAQLVCGDGTIERDGVCAPADEQPGGAPCGLGTELGPEGTCVPSEPTECDPATTMPVYDPDTGVTTCVGTDVDACTPELMCPAPDANRLTICGRIHDMQTDEVIRLPNATGAVCAATTPDGPCSLKVQFYDALVFQEDPTGAPPLLVDSLVVDDCGRYVARNIRTTSFGFIGAVVDDGAGNPDLRVPTAVATTDAMAAPARRFRAYSTRKATEGPWSTAANPPGGPFGTQGVLALIYRHRGLPVPGVVVRRDGAVVPIHDFYFSDPGVTRTTVDPARAMTGPNGTALLVQSNSVVPHDGVGGEPPGCKWPVAPAATVAGVVFVQLKDAESNGGGPCP